MFLAQMKTPDEWRNPALAARWHAAVGFPSEIERLLATNAATRSASPLLVIPDHQVPLRDGARASQTDLWVLARTRRGLLSIAIDADPPQFPAAADASQAAATVERWLAICRLLEVKEQCEPAVQSRFFHRTAAALLEARRFFAAGAAVIVHSVGTRWNSFTDFQRLVAVMGGQVSRPGELVSVAPREGLELHFGWACG